MLGTIRLPSNLKLLGEKLPESNYDSDRENKAISKSNSKYRPNLNPHNPSTKFIKGAELDEIKEVQELETGPVDVRQKRIHKHPKVKSNNEVFALEESPLPNPNQRIQINKVVPTSSNQVQFSVNSGYRDRLSSNEDPMAAI